MARNIPVALAAHLQDEVTTVADCLEIERNDGIIIRMTNHDKDLTVNGVVYSAGAAFNTSAIKTSADLSVDNFQLDLGVDGALVRKVDFDSDIYKRSKFLLSSVNWQSPSDGVLVLARGWIGDITIRNTSFASLQLRGLTQALQRNFLSYYSPTCRVSFGDAKCGVPITPFRTHNQSRRYKIGDWVLVPTPTTVVSLPNLSFEAQAVVANSDSGINEWDHAPASWWSIENAFAGRDGTYYLRGGDDGGNSPVGTTFALTREVGSSGVGMASANVDSGQYIVSLSAFVASPSLSKSDSARVSLTLLNSAGDIIKVIRSDYVIPAYSVWEEITVSGFVVPGTRGIRMALEGVKTSGPLEVAFDNVSLSYWDANSGVYSMAYKSVRIPSYSATDRRVPTNYRFVDNGAVSNGESGVTGWVYGAGSFWRTASFVNALQPVAGVYFLQGGDSGTAIPASEYTLESSAIPLNDLAASGSYLAEIRIRAANIFNLSSAYKVGITFFNSANTPISTVTSLYENAGILEEWKTLNLSTTIPALTTSAKVTLYARSGSGSSADVVFDAVELFILDKSLSNNNDPTSGFSDSIRPTFLTNEGDVTYDGDLIWEAVPLSFAFDEVQNSVSRRVFNALDAAGGEFDFYGAKIIWMTGANAGTESFVRTWNSDTKEFRLYTPTANTISGGDKYMFSQGCGKSIENCTDRFRNAVNFRGEPYLPGPQRILEVFTPGG